MKLLVSSYNYVNQPEWHAKYNKISRCSPAMIIMQIVKIFSLSVSAATLPKPTLVMHVMVK